MIKRKQLNSILIWTSIIFSFSFTSRAQTQKGIDIDGEAIGDGAGYSVSMPDANTMAIGAPYNDANGNNAGQVRIYSWNGNAWIQKGMDINGEAADDWSGYSVSMPDSNTVAIGAPNNDGNGNNAGHVRIYSWNGSVWVQKDMDLDGETTGDWSGYSVSMPDGNTVAIGAPFNSSLTGNVRIYYWNGSGWAQKGLSIYGYILQWEEFGSAVSMPDVNTVAIGAPETDLDWNGYVHVYAWNGSTWIQKGLAIDGEEFAVNSGRSVSMPDANTVAIGAPGQGWSGSDAGYVRICSWNGSAWIQKGLDIVGEAANDESGYSVSMPDNNTVAIGSRSNNGNGTLTGHVRIYNWVGGTWVQIGNDMDGEATYDHSGWNVSMPDAQTVGIGAYLNDGNGTDAGHARVYSICATFYSYSASACSSYISPSGSQTWTSSGTYVDIIPNAVGCDSVITVNLTIGTPGIDVITDCNSHIWIDGNTYTVSNNSATWTLTNIAGCDSVVTLDLTIANSSSGTDVISACDSYTWIDGNTYTFSNNSATWSLTNMAGCDSVVTLDLSIANSSLGTDVISACDSYTWIDGNTYMVSTNSPTYTYSGGSVNGCDSIVTLSLIIFTVDTLVINASPILTTIATDATYQWLDCNLGMASISGETGQSYIANTNGSYAIEVSQNGCVDTSLCLLVNNVGVLAAFLEYGTSVNPNPSEGSFTLTFEQVPQGYFEIVDLLGCIHRREKLHNALNYQINDLQSGAYLLIIHNANDDSEIKRLMVD